MAPFRCAKAVGKANTVPTKRGPVSGLSCKVPNAYVSPFPGPVPLATATASSSGARFLSAVPSSAAPSLADSGLEQVPQQSARSYMNGIKQQGQATTKLDSERPPDVHFNPRQQQQQDRDRVQQGHGSWFVPSNRCSMEPMDSSGGVSGLGTPDGGHVDFNPQVALTADVEPFFIEDLYATDLDFTQHRV